MMLVILPPSGDPRDDCPTLIYALPYKHFALYEIIIFWQILFRFVNLEYVIDDFKIDFINFLYSELYATGLKLIESWIIGCDVV